MQKLLLSIFFISLCAFPALAQSSDDYNKVEFYGGYSRASVQPNVKSSTAFGTTFEQCSSAATDILGKNFQSSFCHRRGFNGFDTSITYNLNRYLGIKANVTAHSRTEPFTDTFAGTAETNTITERIYNFLVGVQVKNNEKDAHFKPFAHALVGAARNTRKEVNTSPIPLDNFTNRAKVTSFAMKLGGGIDLSTHRRIDLRLVEVDYNPIFTRDFDVAGNPFSVIHAKTRTAHNFTIGFGIVIH
jgi:opacity protein-like surface antigen